MVYLRITEEQIHSPSSSLLGEFPDPKMVGMSS
jgi:hypothetical protein